jgi:tagatose 1,6-diphosphate aldolase GatY/KbaY
VLYPSIQLLTTAQTQGYALGAFNIYNLEGILAVVRAVEINQSPVIVQIHPAALQLSGSILFDLCLAAARRANVPVAVHLDHCNNLIVIRQALDAGMTSIMADGSHLDYEANVAFTRMIAEEVHAHGGVVEAELGRLTGMEDGISVEERESRLTQPEQCIDFVNRTHVDMLAICIGNVHGHYSSTPRLDFSRLRTIRQSIDIPLVLHGASGLPEAMIRQAIIMGICKFNVNTDLRDAYLATLKESFLKTDSVELVSLLDRSVNNMQAVVAEKLQLFGSIGKACSL